MSAPGSDLAFRVADRIRSSEPWEVYADRSRRYEIHLNGTEVELARGPITLEGYGLRVFQHRGTTSGVGFEASTDPSDEGIHATLEGATRIARHSEFPTRAVELPSGSASGPRGGGSIDQALWDRPFESIESYLTTLCAQFEGQKGVALSFGSVKATLTETSLANSAGLRSSFARTAVELEVAVKASGGPEGRPPGEYWVNDVMRRLDPAALPGTVRDWCQFATDVRTAVPPPTGELPVLLPSSVLAGILPGVLGFRLSGAARLKNLAPETGAEVAAPSVTILDDGTYPWAIESSPVDDEGRTQGRRTLVDSGRVTSLLYDALHAGAFEVPATGPAVRDRIFDYFDWKRFVRAPTVQSSTIVLREGDGGNDQELLEAAQDGIWVQQLGWARPNYASGVFGGEIRIGYRIRGGKKAEPVRGGIVGGTAFGTGDAPTLLRNIAAVGSHSTLSGEIASPTLLVRPLSVAGASS
jgi:predicted Zn-dependent protease